MAVSYTNLIIQEIKNYLFTIFLIISLFNYNPIKYLIIYNLCINTGGGLCVCV